MPVRPEAQTSRYTGRKRCVGWLSTIATLKKQTSWKCSPSRICFSAFKTPAADAVKLIGGDDPTVAERMDVENKIGQLKLMRESHLEGLADVQHKIET